MFKMRKKQISADKSDCQKEFIINKKVCCFFLCVFFLLLFFSKSPYNVLLNKDDGDTIGSTKPTSPSENWIIGLHVPSRRGEKMRT